MENNYRHTNTTVSLINYHFVFCPRYRRKIFLIPKVEQRFKELVKLKCQELGINVIAIECDKDHSHMFLNSYGTVLVWEDGGTSFTKTNTEAWCYAKLYEGDN